MTTRDRPDAPKIVSRRSMGAKKSRAPLPMVPPGVTRPLTRSECVGGQRPCPWVSCRHHLYLDVTGSGGLRLNFPLIGPEELKQMENTCSLDVADEGEHALGDVAAAMGGLSRERARQLNNEALARFESRLNGHGLELARELAESSEALRLPSNYDLAMDFTGDDE